MQKYRDVVLDNKGNALLGATVTITDNVGGGTSTLFSDNGVTALANPFTASSVDGAFEFYAANGHYDIKITKSGFDDETITDIFLDDLTPVEVLTGPNAISVIIPTTHIITTGADAFTLADGVEGQEKYIILITYGGDGTVTPTNLAGSDTTIAFQASDAYAYLLFTNSEWYVIGTNAVVS